MDFNSATLARAAAEGLFISESKWRCGACEEDILPDLVAAHLDSPHHYKKRKWYIARQQLQDRAKNGLLPPYIVIRNGEEWCPLCDKNATYEHLVSPRHEQHFKYQDNEKVEALLQQQEAQQHRHIERRQEDATAGAVAGAALPGEVA